jgi:small subunit ribosomal protein S8
MNLFCDLTSKLKNAIKSNKKFIILPKNSFCFNFLKLLFLEGFISSVVELNSGKLLKVSLKYNSSGSPCFKTIKLFSTPGNPQYVNFIGLTKLSYGVNVFIISTPNGLLTNQTCLKRKIGGTVLCSII